MAVFLKTQVVEIIKSCGIELTFNGYNDKRKTFRRVKCYIKMPIDTTKLFDVESKLKEVFVDTFIKMELGGGEYCRDCGDNIRVYFKL